VKDSRYLPQRFFTFDNLTIRPLYMDVSIIIINYRTTELISNCLRSIYANTLHVNFEIIIVDNDPVHGGGDQIRAAFPQIRYIDMEYNSGFGRANNRGMQEAKGKYLLLLNADTLIVDDVIENCVKRMDKQTDIIACSVPQYNSQHKPMHFYKSFNEIRKTFFIIPPNGALEKWIDRIYPEPVYTDPNQHDWLIGAFIFVRRKGYEATQGFDEDFFMYAEDVEWSHRLSKFGKLYYFNDLKFIHLENENPFRRTNITWINRFSTQMQVSNMLWIRKQYGLIPYLFLILHYLIMIPVVYLWKVSQNLSQKKKPFLDLQTQHIFKRKTLVLLHYFWKTVFKNKFLFKITPSENIDLLTKL
jgi:GT2 family glycosyltransferase